MCIDNRVHVPVGCFRQCIEDIGTKLTYKPEEFMVFVRHTYIDVMMGFDIVPNQAFVLCVDVICVLTDGHVMYSRVMEE